MELRAPAIDAEVLVCVLRAVMSAVSNCKGPLEEPVEVAVGCSHARMAQWPSVRCATRSAPDALCTAGYQVRLTHILYHTQPYSAALHATVCIHDRLQRTSETYCHWHNQAERPNASPQHDPFLDKQDG